MLLYKLVSTPDCPSHRVTNSLANTPDTCSDIANQIPQFINGSHDVFIQECHIKTCNKSICNKDYGAFQIPYHLECTIYHTIKIYMYIEIFCTCTSRASESCDSHLNR